jgi:hypothetical protein
VRYVGNFIPDIDEMTPKMFCAEKSLSEIKTSLNNVCKLDKPKVYNIDPDF